MGDGNGKFLKVSNIDQRGWHSGEHAGSITVPLRHLPMTGSFALSPEHAVRPMSHHTGLIERHRCPKCQTQMVLKRIAPARLGFDVRTFECINCDHIHKEHRAADPMTSSEVLGWFLGELKTPN
jgi:hypothetical protein